YGQAQNPEVFYLAPTSRRSLYSGDADFMRRIGEKVATEEQDLGSVNPLIDNEIFGHFTGRKSPQPLGDRQSLVNEEINKVMAGSLSLNQQLTNLGRTYEKRKEQMHLTPEASLRVLATAL